MPNRIKPEGDIIDYKIIEVLPESVENNLDQYVEFFYRHLDKFKDEKSSIRECLRYFVDKKKGGHFFAAVGGSDEMLGATVILKTHMKGFVPENFLVYIVTHEKCRGKGVGGALLNYVASQVKGDICLHVEHDNPAVHLYKRKNFTNKYLEMRLHR